MWTESTQDTFITVLSSLFLAKESAGVFLGQQGDRIVWTESRQDCVSRCFPPYFLQLQCYFLGTAGRQDRK